MISGRREVEGGGQEGGYGPTRPRGERFIQRPFQANTSDIMSDGCYSGGMEERWKDASEHYT